MDVITVADRLEASGELEAAGGLAYLAELAAEHPQRLQYPRLRPGGAGAGQPAQA